VLARHYSSSELDMLIFLRKNFYKTEICYPSAGGDADHEGNCSNFLHIVAYALTNC